MFTGYHARQRVYSLYHATRGPKSLFQEVSSPILDPGRNQKEPSKHTLYTLYCNKVLTMFSKMSIHDA